MSSNKDFLKVKGEDIVNGTGETVRLRGFCLGGWMNMENFIAGYPGNESGLRAAIAQVLGAEKAKFFFQRFLDYFLTESDIRFIKELGATVVRIPLNYRHFEDDNRPFEYKEEGFRILDRVIGWCRTQGLYVIIDLHAAPGWQNPDWHSDNPGIQALLWKQKPYQDRTVGLWEEFARHYKDEPFVAGYNLLNEPMAPNISTLDAFYQRVTAAIRNIDQDHILFLEGNMFSSEFDGIKSSLDKNTVYSSHNYVVPSYDPDFAGEYPGEYKGETYDRARLEKEYLEGNTFMREHGIPTWVGEFGSIYDGRELDESRYRAVEDMIDIFEQYKHHWTIWTYKDIGVMGTVYTDPKSEWMRRTLPIREKKKALLADTWGVSGGEVESITNRLIDLAKRVCGDALQLDGFDGLIWRMNRAMRGVIFSESLLPLYAEQFRGMSEEDIDRMMQSFHIDNCVRREKLAGVLKKYMS